MCSFPATLLMYATSLWVTPIFLECGESEWTISMYQVITTSGIYPNSEKNLDMDTVKTAVNAPVTSHLKSWTMENDPCRAQNSIC